MRPRNIAVSAVGMVICLSIAAGSGCSIDDVETPEDRVEEVESDLTLP